MNYYSCFFVVVFCFFVYLPFFSSTQIVRNNTYGLGSDRGYCDLECWIRPVADIITDVMVLVPLGLKTNLTGIGQISDQTFQKMGLTK